MLKIENVQPSNGVTSTKNADGSIKMSGTITAGWFAVDSYESVDIPAGTYTFSINKPIDKNCRLDVKYEDNTTQNLPSISSGNTSRTYTFGQKVVGYFIEFPSMTSGANVDYTLKFQLEQGSTATDYEPYTGGIPAPNPKYPYAIKNTGDNGSVNEKVQNRNLIDVSYTKENPLNINGSFTIINLDLQADKVKNIIKAGDTIRLSCKAISNGGTITRSQLYLGNGTNTSYLPASMITITNQESTISNYGTMQNDIVETGNHQLMVVMYASSGENYKVYDFMLEKVESNGEVTYVPHEEQNISFPLAEGQKFYEGSHPDDDEKVHHKMGEIILDGTVGGYNAEHNWFYISKGNITSNVKSFELLSNYFKNIVYASFESDNNLNGITWNSSILNNVTHLLIRNTNCNNATEYKNWLAEVLPKVQFPLAEEQTEDFTEEQKTAWEEIKKARTYKNITHISSEDETPANVEIEYVRDINTIDDRITALENKINS